MELNKEEMNIVMQALSLMKAPAAVLLREKVTKAYMSADDVPVRKPRETKKTETVEKVEE